MRHAHAEGRFVEHVRVDDVAAHRPHAFSVLCIARTKCRNVQTYLELNIMLSQCAAHVMLSLSAA